MFSKKWKIFLANISTISTSAVLFSCQTNDNLEKQKILDEIIQIPLFIEGQDYIKVKNQQNQDIDLNLLDYSLFYYGRELNQNTFEKGIKNKDIDPDSTETDPTIKTSNNNDVLIGYSYHGISELKSSEFLQKWKENEGKNNIWFWKYGDGFYINNPFFTKYNLFSQSLGLQTNPAVEQSVGSLGTFWWNIDYSKLSSLPFDSNFQRKKELVAKLDKYTITKEREVFDFDGKSDNANDLDKKDLKKKVDQAFKAQLRASFEFDDQTIADDKNNELKNVIFKLYWVQDAENGINYPDDSRFSYSGLYSVPISQLKSNPNVLSAQRRINVKGFVGVNFQELINNAFKENIQKQKE